MNPQKKIVIALPNSSTWLASMSLLFNYGARMVVPVIAHVVCVILGCDAATLIGATSSAFFIGDWLAQLTASPLVSRLGGKQLLCVSTAGWALMMFLMPMLFHCRSLLLLAQGLLGLVCGFGYPSSHAIIAATVAETQKSTAVSLINAAGGLGSMFGNFTTPFFVEYWHAAFQIFSVIGVVTMILLAVYCPAIQGRRLSKEVPIKSSAKEKNHIQEMKEWMKEPLIQGIVLTYWANGVIWYGFYQSYLPSLFIEVYDVPVAELGWVATTSPLMYAVTSILVGILADSLISSNWKKHNCCALMQCIGTAVPAITFLSLCFVSDRGIATGLTTIGWGFHAFQGSGVTPLLHDVAKHRAAELFVLANTFAKFAGVLASALLGYAVRTVGWKIVLLILAAHYVIEGVLLVPLIGRTEYVHERLFKEDSSSDSQAKKES